MSGSSLRTLYNAIMTDVRSLESLDVDTVACAPILVPLLEEKLPSCVKGNMAELDKVDKFKLKDFLEAIKSQVERYEAEQQNDLDLNNPNKMIMSDTFSMYSATPQSTIGSCASMCNTMCPICGSNRHGAVGCNLTLKQKRELVEAKRLCRLCLLPGHFFYTCTSALKCKTCSGLHHDSLHGIEWKAPGSQPRKSNSRRRRGNDRGSGVTSQSPVNPETALCGFVGDRQVVLVKTAKATAEYDGRKMAVRLFIDEGSQRSYLRTHVAQQLGVRPTEYVELGISGFNNTYSKEVYGKAMIGIVTSEG